VNGKNKKENCNGPLGIRSGPTRRPSGRIGGGYRGIGRLFCRSVVVLKVIRGRVNIRWGRRSVTASYRQRLTSSSSKRSVVQTKVVNSQSSAGS